MKKVLIAIVCILFSFAIMSVAGANAEQEFTFDIYTYQLKNDDTIKILYRNTSNMDNADNPDPTMTNIPSLIEGKRVTEIGDNVFIYCYSLTDCAIDDGIETIGKGVFFCCNNLRYVTLPDTLTSIGDSAFGGCGRLGSIVLPDSLEEIGEGAFHSSINLTEIRIPDSTTQIGGNPFAFCSNLQNLVISENHPSLEYKNGVLFSKPDKRLIYYSELNNDNSYVIPDGIEVIGWQAFANCSTLNDIVIPNSVRTIGESAFTTCKGLTSLTIPDGVESIGSGAFNFCRNLQSITIPESVSVIGDSVFYSCDENLIVTVAHDSYAEQYCIENGIDYVYDDENYDDTIELARFIGNDFNSAGTELNLSLDNYEEGEFSYTYSNDYILLGSYDGQTIDSVLIYDDDSYSLFGARIWLPRFEAEEQLSQYGYSISEEYDDMGIYVNHDNNSALIICYESNTLQTITSIEFWNEY